VRVSVALGTHNGARFVAHQVASMLEQSRPIDELVISDDASRDGTVDIVRTLVATAAVPPRLVEVRNPEPLGVTANFAQAIAACTGDLIALSDQDDRWHPTRIERSIVPFADDPALLLVHSDATLVDAEGQPLGGTLFEALGVSSRERELYAQGRAVEALLRRNLATGATMMFRRALLERASPIPSGWVHDEWLAIVAAATGRVVMIDEPLIDYRQHGSNQIGAARLTFAQKVGRMLEPRSDRNARLEANFGLLAERLSSDPLAAVTDERVQQFAREKAVHERARLAYPVSRWRRPGPVLREWRAGRYRWSARGVLDVVRDLAQPAGSRSIE
jgi:glycosyltransferase involved in cell wall biosynthesis